MIVPLSRRRQDAAAAGRQAAEHVLDQFGAAYPAAMRCFSDDLEASLAHLDLPLAHRKVVRTTNLTTNLIERSFEEERRRTKTLPRFFSARSGLKLAFAVLWRASQRWQRGRITSLERKQLELLRQRLGDRRAGPGARPPCSAPSGGDRFMNGPFPFYRNLRT